MPFNSSFKRLLLIGLLFIVSGLALGFSKTVLLGERFCDDEAGVCIKGSVEWDAAKGLLEFHGRVGQVRQSGKLKIELIAQQRNGSTKKVKFSVPVSGRSFALVETKKRVGKNWDKTWRNARWGINRCHFSARK